MDSHYINGCCSLCFWHRGLVLNSLRLKGEIQPYEQPLSIHINENIDGNQSIGIKLIFWNDTSKELIKLFHVICDQSGQYIINPPFIYGNDPSENFILLLRKLKKSNITNIEFIQWIEKQSHSN